ncbi:MAG: hypothetical protein IT346_02760 [Epsilonproteobacteria bacterium]|nr:hypothetical protein [Campylobacterota bacterium]
MKYQSCLAAYLLAALSMFCATTSHAMITEIREFHNPKLGPDSKGQTIILMGDQHGCSNEISNRQSVALAKAMVESQACLITEGFQRDSISLSMEQLTQAVEQHNLTIVYPEFRAEYGALVGFFLVAARQHSGYKELTTALKEPAAATYLGATFVKAHEENCTQFDQVLVPYAYSLKRLPGDEDKAVTQGFMEGFDALLGPTDKVINTIDQALISMPEQKNSSLAHVLMDEFVIKKDDNTYNLNDNSLWCTMEQATNSVFDATLLKTIHEQRKQRVLFVHAGALHTQKLATLLPLAGFEMKAADVHQQDLSRTMSEVMSDIKSLSTKSAELAVDVDTFLARCETSPRT